MVLQWQKKLVRREVKSMINVGLKDPDLLKFTFAKKDINTLLKWEKKDEFEYFGQMYDIVRSNESKDSITYMCWKDDNESAIKKKLNTLSEIVWHKNSNNKNHNERKSDFYKTLICPDQWSMVHHWSFKASDKIKPISPSNIFFNSFLKGPISPPPEYDKRLIPMILLCA